MSDCTVLVLLLFGFSVISQVSTQNNVAIGKPTVQSHVGFGGLAENAIDDNTATCTHTGFQTRDIWWCVDLQDIIHLDNITIYNTQQNQERISGFEVSFSLDGECGLGTLRDSEVCYVENNPTGQAIYTVSSCTQQLAMMARIVFVSRRAQPSNALTLCEVQVFRQADDFCPEVGKYGTTCNSFCPQNCASFCRRTDGYCMSGCNDGYWGFNGFCREECPNCAAGGCNVLTGICNNGCKAGWRSAPCDVRCNAKCTNGCNQDNGICEDCVDGSFGAYCNGVCPSCNGPSCERVTGACDSGCSAGFWGTSCGNTCPNCLTGCDVVTGNCNTGCREGWSGVKCDAPCDSRCIAGCDRATGSCTQCSSGSFGALCNETCNPGCANNICSQLDGKCTCKSTHYGLKCENMCSENCEKGECRGVHPGCTRGCVAGYRGGYCENSCPSNCVNCSRFDNQCYACRPGSFGDTCQSTCSAKCVGGCYERSGVCVGCNNGEFGEFCEKPCPVNCRDGSCGRYNGVCSQCKPGTFGSTCSSTCSAGCLSNGNTDTCSTTGRCLYGCIPTRYGDVCDTACNSCDGSCDRDSGRCLLCASGFYGEACNVRCSFTCAGGCDRALGICNRCAQGYFGERCDKTCSAACKDGCDRTLGCVNCVDGYYGPNCNLNCSSTCGGGCNRISGTCNRCPSGFFGENCERRCSTTCSTCDSTSGCLSCDNGFYGSDCNSKCSQNCDGGCDRGTGSCTRCVPGFFGSTCNNRCSPTCKDGCDQSARCVNCMDGYHGSSCNLNCSTGCDGGCDRGTGICARCAPGYFGGTCNNQCSSTCKVCDRSSGCVNCVDGYHGNSCNLKCSTGCDGDCDKATGLCRRCLPGYIGGNCSSGCPSNCKGGCDISGCVNCMNGSYGSDCNLTCSQTCAGGCNRISGICESCVQGYFGDMCNGMCAGTCKDGCDRSSRCVNCMDGFYGPTCNSTCSNTCDKDCDRSTGRCGKCVTGFYGDLCDLPCQSQCEDNLCTRQGACKLGCKGGKSGANCDQDCNTNCELCYQNDANNCSRCAEGKYGPMCDLQCDSNCMPTTVGSNPVCDIATGQCSAGCKTGLYGSMCNALCSSDCANQQCHQMTGVCSVGCVAGKTGDNCSQACGVGYYGVDCKSKCGHCADGTCDIITGHCAEAGCVDECGVCQDGYRGPRCAEAIVAPPSGINWFIYGPILGGFLLLLLIIIILICCLICRRRRKKKKQQDHARVYNPEPEQAVVYENYHYMQPALQTHSSDKEVKGDALYASVDKRKQNGKPLDANGGLHHVGVTGEQSGLPYSSITRVDLGHLWNYTQKQKAHAGLSEEFSELPKDLCQPHDVGMNDVNKSKNRYKSVCAFDATRVKLVPEDGDPNSDYINACYITAYGNPGFKNIASQGPNIVNINEFYRMVWDTNAVKIVMLTKLFEQAAEKCLKYWPEIGKKLKFGKIRVKLIREDVYSNFVIRELKMTKDDETRKFYQYHYMSWPDKGVPADVVSLVEFRQKVRKPVSAMAGPMIVHCSAGIGRTGTFLALDYLMDEGRDLESVDIFSCVTQMRKERVNMVQTQGQYVFLHDALCEWYLAGLTTTTLTDFPDLYQKLCDTSPSTGRSEFDDKFEIINQLTPVPKDVDYSEALLPVNSSKNRDGSILASNRCSHYLKYTADNNELTGYINAVYVPSYKKKNGYVLTQSPLPNTVTDFWNMVNECQSNIIIDFDYASSSQSLENYIPEPTLSADNITVTKTSEQLHESGFYTCINCSLQHPDESKSVEIYRCHFWNNDNLTPDSIYPFFVLFAGINKISNTINNVAPLVAHCLNGAMKSGLFCVLDSVMERLATENDVSVLQTILQLRQARPQLILSPLQLRFCYDVINYYLQNFSSEKSS